MSDYMVRRFAALSLGLGSRPEKLTQEDIDKALPMVEPESRRERVRKALA